MHIYPAWPALWEISCIRNPFLLAGMSYEIIQVMEANRPLYSYCNFLLYTIILFSNVPRSDLAANLGRSIVVGSPSYDDYLLHVPTPGNKQ